MDKNELYNLLSVREKQFEKAKERRNIKTILAFAALFFILICKYEDITGLDYIAVAVVSIILAGIHFFINAIVFSTLFQASEDERKALDYLRKQLSE